MRDAFSPLFAVCIFFLFIGHWVTIYSPILVPFIIFFIFNALLVFLYRSYIFSYLCCCLAIALLIVFGFLSKKELYFEMKEQAFPLDSYVSIKGQLLDYPEVREKNFVLLIKALSVEWGGKEIQTQQRIRINVQGRYDNLNRGDWLIVDAQFSPPDLNQNFFKNSYEDYLLEQGIHRRASCKSAELIQVVRSASWGWRLIGGWRRSIRKAIGDYYNRRGLLAPEGVFLEAILLGDRGKLDERIEEELIRSGVLHVIAISGANIGIIAFFCLWILRGFGMRRMTRYGITTVILLLFLVISGFDVSANRAVSMALMIFAARIFFRDFCITQVIAFSGLLMLMINPSCFLDPGFILTFGLTYAIVFGREIFSTFLKGNFRTIREFVVANLSASFLSFPFSLYFFKRFSFAGLLSGFILVPLSVPITAGGLLLVPLAPLSGRASAWILKILNIPLKLFFSITSFFSRLNLDIFRSPPSPVLLFFLFFLFAIIAFVRFPSIFRNFLIGLGLFLWSIPLIQFNYNPRNLEVFFLDVGQGDCEAVVFPGGNCLLIDGGGSYFSDFKIGKRLVAPFLLQKKIKVKWVAVTHFHPDHVAGLLEVLPMINPHEIWISSAPDENLFYNEIKKWANSKVKIIKVCRGYSREIANCKVDVLFPESFIDTKKTENDHSMVIRVSDSFHSFLLTGDIEKNAEQRLIEIEGSSLSSTVIKVPHHGSRQSACVSFLKVVQPHLAVFSLNSSNNFNFPHPEFMRIIKELRIPWISTSRRGGIFIESLPKKLRISVSK